jgi:uncharacterized protein (TIGR02118 family)
MAARLLVQYHTPADADAFDRYYFATHVPLAKKIPGLRSYRVSSGPVTTPDGSRPFHLVAELDFDSMEALRQALSSPEGEATAADLGNFARAGVALSMYETREL